MYVDKQEFMKNNAAFAASNNSAQVQPAPAQSSPAQSSPAQPALQQVVQSIAAKLTEELYSNQKYVETGRIFRNARLSRYEVVMASEKTALIDMEFVLRPLSENEAGDIGALIAMNKLPNDLKRIIPNGKFIARVSLEKRFDDWHYNVVSID
jgi:hypothetical protein